MHIAIKLIRQNVLSQIYAPSGRSSVTLVLKYKHVLIGVNNHFLQVYKSISLCVEDHSQHHVYTSRHTIHVAATIVLRGPFSSVGGRSDIYFSFVAETSLSVELHPAGQYFATP
jgi:hypothetical protein